MIDSAISITGLRKTYGRGSQSVEALKGIDLEVARGQIFGLLGPNGAGKTTTVGACTTRVRPTAGTVLVEGIDVVRREAEAKAVLGVVSQFRTLDRSLDLWQNLYTHCLYFGMSRRDSRARADQLLELFRLADRRTAVPDALSGGMAQRLQIARAVAHRPRVLFLDEPTAGLDPQSRLALWEIVRGMHADGITVLLTTHNMEEADSLCARVAIIDHGRILVSDTPDALKRSTGAETVIELRLEHTDDGLPQRLRAMPEVIRCEEMPGGLRLFASSADGLLVRLVGAAQGNGLRDVSVNEPTLETVFISLTGRDLRE